MIDVELLMDTLEGIGLAPRLTSSDKEILVTHDECGDSGGHLYISAEHGAWICFHCQASGSIYTLLEEVVGMRGYSAFLLARRILETTNYVPVRRAPDQKDQEIELPEEFIPSNGIDDMASRYLRNRGFRPALARKYDMGYCLRGRYAYRLVVPVYTEGKLRTFIARAIVSVLEKKVLIPSGSRASHALFNIDNVAPPLCIVVEGVFDALRLRQYAIASLGTTLSDYQIDLLRTKGFRGIVVMRDGDEAGRTAARKDADALVAMGFRVCVAQLPDGVDPGSASERQLAEALDSMSPPMVQLGQS